MKSKILLSSFILLLFFTSSAQESNFKNFKKLSHPEKCWVIWHPFKAKKAHQISVEAREITELVKNDSILIGNGNGQQIDAFRHAYWMANLTQKIGWRKAKKLGKAHEKVNYKDYKKRKSEDGEIPDKISSEMDLHNNLIGIEIGKNKANSNIKQLVIEAIKKGACKIIKTDNFGNYLDCNGNVIPVNELKGKWENNKCLINSNLI